MQRPPRRSSAGDRVSAPCPQSLPSPSPAHGRRTPPPRPRCCLGTQVCPALCRVSLSQGHTVPRSSPHSFLGSTGSHRPGSWGRALWPPGFLSLKLGVGPWALPRGDTGEHGKLQLGRGRPLPPGGNEGNRKAPLMKGPRQPRSCRPPGRALPSRSCLSVGKSRPLLPPILWSTPVIAVRHPAPPPTSAPGAPREIVPPSPPAPFWTPTPWLGPQKLKCRTRYPFHLLLLLASVRHSTSAAPQDQR